MAVELAGDIAAVTAIGRRAPGDYAFIIAQCGESHHPCVHRSYIDQFRGHAACFNVPPRHHSSVLAQDRYGHKAPVMATMSVKDAMSPGTVGYPQPTTVPLLLRAKNPSMVPTTSTISFRLAMSPSMKIGCLRGLLFESLFIIFTVDLFFKKTFPAALY